MLIRTSHLLLFCVGFLLTTQVAFAKKPKKKAYSEPLASEKPYLFSWPDFKGTKVELRGGSSTGGKIDLVKEPGEYWTKLQDESLGAVERDQAAIRALSGDYRVPFDFLETMVFGGVTEPSKPYRSWATERVYILEDTPGFISLQHILVMFYVDDKGETQGPAVIKHWRQDWRYEPETIVEYTGHRHWTPRALSEEERVGKWSQTVYQVDDTPRYALIGDWDHNANFSAWTSNVGWRPLPRREYTVRNDYHVLDGLNRLTVLPTGWVHEQDNLKRVLDASGGPSRDNPVLAREIGINRYHQLVDFDFSAGDAYWQKTAGFWVHVRTELAARFGAGQRLRVGTKCQEELVYKQFFGLAAAVESGELTDEQEMLTKVKATFDCIVTAPE